MSSHFHPLRVLFSLISLPLSLSRPITNFIWLINIILYLPWYIRKKKLDVCQSFTDSRAMWHNLHANTIFACKIYCLPVRVNHFLDTPDHVLWDCGIRWVQWASHQIISKETKYCDWKNPVQFSVQNKMSVTQRIQMYKNEMVWNLETCHLMSISRVWFIWAVSRRFITIDYYFHAFKWFIHQ